MAKSEHLRLLIAAISSKDWSEWNNWRSANPNLFPDLRETALPDADLSFADLSGADMRGANLRKACLASAKLGGAKFADANLSEANLSNTDLKCAHLQRADLSGANLSGADVRYADLRGTNLANADLSNARVDPADLRRAINAKINHAEAGSPDRTITPIRNPTAERTLYRRLRNLISAGGSWLASVTPGLFRREKLVTLALSKGEEAKPSRPEESHPRPEKPASPSN